MAPSNSTEILNMKIRMAFLTRQLSTVISIDDLLVMEDMVIDLSDAINERKDVLVRAEIKYIANRS